MNLLHGNQSGPRERGLNAQKRHSRGRQDAYLKKSEVLGSGKFSDYSQIWKGLFK